MEKFDECNEKAQKYLKIADHILTQTYPLIGDSKLLLAAMENLFLSLANSMSSILHLERYYKLIPLFQENFDSKFNLFKLKLAEKHDLKEYVIFISRIKEIISSHKRSPVEFSRKDAFVICSDDYSLDVISFDKLKNYLFKTREFVQLTDKIVKNGRLS